MRISDWSSDVCSSDLLVAVAAPAALTEISTGKPQKYGLTLLASPSSTEPPPKNDAMLDALPTPCFASGSYSSEPRWVSPGVPEPQQGFQMPLMSDRRSAGRRGGEGCLRECRSRRAV